LVKQQSPQIAGFVVLQRSNIFSKEVFKFFLGKESINHFKDHIFFFGFKLTSYENNKSIEYKYGADGERYNLYYVKLHIE
jgi:hypothetical protein